jgi:hypothetical protein
MENTGQLEPEEIKIQGLLDRFLISRSAERDASAAPGLHLDDDSLAAFAEGNLSRREAAPIVSHLVDCSFCRHITAELVRLDMEFASADEIVRPAAIASEPAKVSEVLSGLLSRIFGTSDGAVFAHNEEEKKDEDPEAETDEDEKQV